MPGSPPNAFIGPTRVVRIPTTTIDPGRLSPDFASQPDMEHTHAADEGLNLGQHRSDTSVWDRRGWDGTTERHSAIRLLVGIGGGALALQGIRLGTWKGRMLAGLGSTLAWWAITGEGDLTEARRWFTDTLQGANGPLAWARNRAATGDTVTDASAESFPASDAPAWTPTVGTGLRRSPGRN